MKKFYLNHTIDKNELKRLFIWFLATYGRAKTSQLADSMKYAGFHYATKAGISLGVDDLQIPSLKKVFVQTSQTDVASGELSFERGESTALERFRKIIETWSWTSEMVKDEVITNFRKNHTLNPVYMMSFSGARGNVSQVRQLVGMRGLMSDPQGNLIDLPIQSNFREGLTIIEYVISCYGARKGLVDTALRTANSGYLTRRLVEVAQAITIYTVDCGTFQGIKVRSLPNPDDKTAKPLIQFEDRLVGRVLGETFHQKYARRNQDITRPLARAIATLRSHAKIRSPLTCATQKGRICQFCYGWNLAQTKLVPLGEAVGVVAAQSIGEPGTQLTMRTFHTGGIFSGNVGEKVIAPFEGTISLSQASGRIVRSSRGEAAFVCFETLHLRLSPANGGESKYYTFPPRSILYVAPGQFVFQKQVLAESVDPSEAVSDNSTPQAMDELQVTADTSGQIYFEDFVLVQVPDLQGREVSKAFRTSDLWDLSGDIIPAESLYFQGDILSEPSSKIFSYHKDRHPTQEIRFLDKKSSLLVIREDHQKILRLPPSHVSIPQVGDLLKKGDELIPGERVPTSFVVTRCARQPDGSCELTLRHVRPYLVSRAAVVNVSNSQLVKTGDALFVLRYTKKKTGDIVQGLPKIEQLFEARQKQGMRNPKTLAFYWFFCLRQKGFSFHQATSLSLRITQNFLVNSIQQVYQSQGVALSDKHLEIIVRRMTSYVFIFDPGKTAFLPGECVDHSFVLAINSSSGVRSAPADYIPFVLGITKIGLAADSFLSAASFQETRRVLMKAALRGEVDHLSELKQAVMLGKLLPVGTTSRAVSRARWHLTRHF